MEADRENKIHSLVIDNGGFVASDGSILKFASDYLDLYSSSVISDPYEILTRVDSYDNMLFGEASALGVMSIQEVLSKYSACSGHVINFNKSSVFFGSIVAVSNIQDVCRIFGVAAQSNPEKYLGLPSFIGINKKHALAELRARCLQQIHNRSAKALSMGGNEGEHVKINVDASFSPTEAKSSSGLVI
ncbi:hypothetical protein V6N13_123581 [Hibiscus sabdariffa]